MWIVFMVSTVMRPKHFLKRLNECRSTGQFTDFTVIVRGRRFPTHRIVLANLSNKFRSIFENTKNDKKETELNDLDPDVFSTILDYAYTGVIPLSSDNVHPILLGAAQLNIQYLTQESQNFIIANLNLQNICPTLQFVYCHSFRFLKERSEDFFFGGLELVCSMKGYLELEPWVLRRVLENDHGTKDEEIVLGAVLYYLSHNYPNDLEITRTLITLVRLCFVNPHSVEGQLKLYDNLKDNEVLKQYVNLGSTMYKASTNKKLFPKLKEFNIPMTWIRPRGVKAVPAHTGDIV